MKVRFSDAFLASHRINQRQRMQILLHVSDVAFKFSPLRLVSSFWLSGHLFLAMQFISELIWVNKRCNKPTWQAKTIISYSSPLIPLKSASARARDRNTARANQSASQECQLATNQRLKSADLRHRRKQTSKPTKPDLRLGLLPLAFGLGRIIRILPKLSSEIPFLTEIMQSKNSSVIHLFCKFITNCFYERKCKLDAWIRK